VNVADHPHRRFNPLTGQPVLVSAGRTDRPWQGSEDAPPRERRPNYDPDCYLCPGNDRVSGATNPQYDSTWAFTNDFPSLREDTPLTERRGHHLLRAASTRGTCRVLCYSPRHDLTMSRMTLEQIGAVIDLWHDQLSELAPEHAWVQVFENRGSQMGASNPHPHGQLWASSHLPHEPALEDRSQRRHVADHGTPLLLAYAEVEADRAERVVVEDDEWLVVVPWWATWPFEVLVLPRRHTARLTQLDGAQRTSLARSLQQLLRRYDGLFGVPFPYSMGWHGAPGLVGDDAHWQLHAHFYPPLLRSATVRKWMVGYEMLADIGRDLTAEEAAERLRAVDVDTSMTS
jgi:UDPglucose--hexose-1-phosphate uridylyltransferase